MAVILKEKSRCCGCGACAAACPGGAITMKADREGFLYPYKDEKLCSRCGRCETLCPFNHEKVNGGEALYLGAQVRNEKVRYASTSGGVFPVLAEMTLEKGGTVFGAVMDEDGTVRHKGIREMEQLARMQKTKYVQSELSDCYEKVKQCLKSKKPVLFSGTPCQCEAVRRYAGGNNENLLLADLVCYGVPSPGLWKKYVRELEKLYGGKVSDFCFRDKRGRDNGHRVSLKTGEKEYSYPMGRDVFCSLYFHGYMLRPSCHFCPFSTVRRNSDITMGDFWGIEKVRPEMDDGMGTSLVILHSQKGAEVWEEVNEKFRYFRCRQEEMMQPRLWEPTPLPKQRPLFHILNRWLSLHNIENLVRKGWL